MLGSLKRLLHWKLNSDHSLTERLSNKYAGVCRIKSIHFKLEKLKMVISFSNLKTGIIIIAHKKDDFGYGVERDRIYCLRSMSIFAWYKDDHSYLHIANSTIIAGKMQTKSSFLAFLFNHSINQNFTPLDFYLFALLCTDVVRILYLF